MSRMRLSSTLLILAMLLTGCGSTKKRRADAVMSAPPPRVGNAYREEPRAEFVTDAATPTLPRGSIPPKIRQVEAKAGDSVGSGTGPHRVVATVNGTPIFASELLERYATKLNEFEKKIPPEEFTKLQNSLIQRDLKNRIERELLVQRLQAKLKKEQIEAVQGQLDGLFAQEIDRLKKELKVNSKIEVENELQKQGTSLDSLRYEFVNQRMATEYLISEARIEKKVSRQDLLKFYRDHIKEYEQPSRAKWQQIQITWAKHGGKSGAFSVLENAIRELQNGADFSEVARRISDGPSATTGGQWDWIQAGSLANQDLEQKLFVLPIGQIEQLETDSAYLLVRVTDRTTLTRTPFEKVQDEIRQKVLEEEQKEATKQVVADLYKGAIIETSFDTE